MTDPASTITATSTNAAVSPENIAPQTALGGEATPKQEAVTSTSMETQVVPEKYELKLPENAVMTAADLEGVSKLAKELGISKSEAAQKIANHQNASLANYRQTVQSEHAKTVAKWADDLKNDADFGGQNYDANVGHAKAALARFDTSGEMGKLLNSSGYGNNPVIVKLFAQIGKAMGEDKFISGKEATASKDPAMILYGNSK